MLSLLTLTTYNSDMTSVKQFKRIGIAILIAAGLFLLVGSGSVFAKPIKVGNWAVDEKPCLMVAKYKNGITLGVLLDNNKTCCRTLCI